MQLNVIRLIEIDTVIMRRSYNLFINVTNRINNHIKYAQFNLKLP